VVLLPFFYKSSKDQALIRKIQPKINEIQKKYKEDKEKQGKELMNLYKEHKLNPFSGFLLLIIQLPIFFALFRIFRNPELITETFDHVTAFGLINLTEVVIPIVVVAAILQYFQGKISLAANKTSNNQQNNNPMAKMGNSMIYITPIISFVVLIQLPSALAVYWITSSLFSIGQQFVINKKIAEVDVLEKNKKENGKNN
jgi:YidC/Oxa1 family membrane protein insertase